MLPCILLLSLVQTLMPNPPLLLSPLLARTLQADTTGLELEEYDRMQRYVLEDRFHEYHGEAINPRHLSYWEIYVMKWGKVGALPTPPGNSLSLSSLSQSGSEATCGVGGATGEAAAAILSPSHVGCFPPSSC